MNFVESILNNNIKLDDLYKELIITFFKQEIKNMLMFIHFKYHECFTKKDMLDYFKKYKMLKINTYSQTKVVKLNKKIHKKILMRKFKNVKSLRNLNNKNKQILKYDKNDKYCNARTWSGGTILKIKEDETGKKTTIYGGRCSRLKVSGGKYCFQHIIKSKHGDYFEVPSDKLIKQYKTYNNL